MSKEKVNVTPEEPTVTHEEAPVDPQSKSNQDDDADTLFPEKFVETKNLGKVIVPQLSFAKMAEITPMLHAIVLRMQVEGVEISPSSFEPELGDMFKIFVSVMPESINLMSAMTGVPHEDFDKLSVSEGGRILICCVQQNWREIAPFFAAFIPQRPAGKQD